MIQEDNTLLLDLTKDVGKTFIFKPLTLYAGKYTIDSTSEYEAVLNFGAETLFNMLQNLNERKDLFKSLSTVLNCDPMDLSISFYLKNELEVRKAGTILPTGTNENHFDTHLPIKTKGFLGIPVADSLKYNFGVYIIPTTEYATRYIFDGVKQKEASYSNKKKIIVKDYSFVLNTKFDDAITYLMNKPFNTYLKKIFYTLKGIVNNSSDTCFIYRKEWIVSYLLENLVDSLNQVTSEEILTEIIKSIYAVFYLLWKESQMEVEQIIPTPPQIPYTISDFDKQNDLMENLKILAEVTLANINATNQSNLLPTDIQSYLDLTL